MDTTTVEKTGLAQDLAHLSFVEKLVGEALGQKDRAKADTYGRRLVQLATGAIYPNAYAEILERFRVDYRAAFAPAKAAVAAPPLGTFTVTHEGSDTYETVRIEEGSGQLAGRVIASYLSGPDNGSDYTGFGFVEAGGRVRPWRRFAGQLGTARWSAAVETVVRMDKDAQLGAREAYATRSGRCSICGRTLTVPVSLLRGMGPICAEKEGVS